MTQQTQSERDASQESKIGGYESGKTKQQWQPRSQDRVKIGSEVCANPNLELELVKYEEEMKVWMQNVDKNYAWIVLAAVWVVFFGLMGPYRMYGFIFAHVTNSGEYTRGDATTPVAAILTVESFVAPLVPPIVKKISARWCICLGGLLIASGNFLAGVSRCLTLDVLFIGVIQGFGFACVFIPHMEVINSYFLKYRSRAFGLSLTGGTIVIFVLSPYTEWLLRTFPWRYSYFGLSPVCLLIIIAGFLIKPNKQPTSPQITNVEKKKADEIEGADCNGADANKEQQVEVTSLRQAQMCSSSMRDMLSMIKIPGFYLICLSQVIYFWIFSIFGLIVVDYGMDRGCTKEQAETLLNFQSLGELVGRLILSAIVDLSSLGPRYTVSIVLVLLTATLFLITQITGYIGLASLNVVIIALSALLYIMLNSLLVQYLGEGKVTLGYGMSTFISGILTAARPVAVGYFRDDLGNYDLLMMFMSASCGVAALLWLVEPLISRCLGLRDARVSSREADDRT